MTYQELPNYDLPDVVASDEAVARSSVPLQAPKRRGRSPNQELNHPRQPRRFNTSRFNATIELYWRV
jgi:hypothetical protein